MTLKQKVIINLTFGILDILIGVLTLNTGRIPYYIAKVSFIST